MIRRRFAIRKQKKAQALYARKWMVEEPQKKAEPMWGRKWMRRHPDGSRGFLARLRSSWSVRIAAGAGGALMATGGMAYAGVLPAPVQRAVARLADRVGIDLPASDDADEIVAGERPDAGDDDSNRSTTADAVHEVIDGRDGFESGRDFGHGVSDAAHAANAERKQAKDEAQATRKSSDDREDDGSVASEHPEHPDKPEKPDVAAEPERPAKPENPAGGPPADKPEKPEKPAGGPPADTPEKPEPPVDVEKPEKPEPPETPDVDKPDVEKPEPPASGKGPKS